MRHASRCAVLAAVAFSVAARAEIPGAPFLTYGPDARYSILGGAGVASRDSRAFGFYNPAALGFVNRFALSWTRADFAPDSFTQTSQDFVGIAYELRPRLGLAMSLNRCQTGMVEATETDLAFTMTGGYRLLPPLALGVAAKAVLLRYFDPSWLPPDDEGASFGFDLGLHYQPWPVLALGLAAANLGPAMEYHSQGEGTRSDMPMPFLFRLGLELEPVRRGPIEITIASDVSRDLVRDIIISPADPFFSTWEQFRKGLGIECRVARAVSLRLGYLEDLPGRGGLLVWREGRHERVSLLRYVTRKHPGRVESLGLTWGFGIEFHRFAVDGGIDLATYRKPWLGSRLQLSYAL